MPEPRKTALVISGGGAKGAFAVGVVKHLFLNHREEGGMRRTLLEIFACTCILTALLFVLTTTSPRAVELGKLPLDNATVLGTTIRTDTSVKSEGKASIRISTSWPTTVCLGEVSRLDIENGTLIYQAEVKCEKLDGVAFLEMWCHVGGGQYFSRGLNSVVSDTSDWTTLQTPFLLQAGQRAEKVILNVVINGRGTVWVDDVRLAIQPLE